MKAREIMTPNPETVTRDSTLQEAARLMRDHDTGFIPVVDDRGSMRLTGVITDRDIAIRHVADGHTEKCCVGDHMSAGSIRSVRPDDDVEEVARIMKSEQVRRVPVCEDGDRLVGVIAQADLAQEADTERTGRVVREISEPGRGQR
jgi:CBS domain-containing protein